jgi:hypothetical protein
VISFSGGLNPSDASNPGEYELISAGKKNSFTGKGTKRIPIAAAAYNAGNNTVTLTPSKKFVPTKPVELIVEGTPPSGLQDTLGRSLTSNGVAILKKAGKGVGVQTMALRAGTVDMLLEKADMIMPRQKRR